MCKRKSKLSLSDLRDIAKTTESNLRVNVLDQFAEDLLLTFLNYDEADIQVHDDGILASAIELSDDGIMCYDSVDSIELIDGKDFHLNYHFIVNGFESAGFVHNAEITFTKIEFNFLNNTWDMLANSVVQERLLVKLNELEYVKMHLVK